MANIEANICKTQKAFNTVPRNWILSLLILYLHNTLVAAVANVFMDKVSMFNATADILAPSLPNVVCARQLK